MKALILTLGVMVSQPAAAHCFTRWYYPYPQHCERSYVHARLLSTRTLHNNGAVIVLLFTLAWKVFYYLL